MSLPIVAIIGRPNVGKSSLFNRFLKRKIAVVDKSPGVTRDRNYAVCDWSGIHFRLVDTGGLDLGETDEFKKHIHDQATFAINEADLILFVVDARTGPTDIDVTIARSLKKSISKTILVANKCDDEKLTSELYEFLGLGIGESQPVSATLGLHVGDLLDKLVEKLPEDKSIEDDKEAITRIALVGRPNVGKSSFINKLIGEQRLIVTPIAGTTRDAVDTPFALDGKNYVLVDTAGLRRKYKVHEDIEFYTSVRTTRAIESCQVAIVLVDATGGVTSQDLRILDQVLTNRRSVVIAVNKWDLIEKDSKTADEFTVEIKDVLANHAYAPLVYVSALTGQRLEKVIKIATEVYQNSCQRVATSELNEFLDEIVRRKHPPARSGKYIKLLYATQSESQPPTFVFFSNHPKLIDKSYISYISNQLRKKFSFEGIPIRLKFRKK